VIRNSIANRLKPEERAVDLHFSKLTDHFMRSPVADSDEVRRALAVHINTVENKDFYLQESYQRVRGDPEFLSQFHEQFRPQLTQELSREKTGKSDARKPRPGRCSLEELANLELVSRKIGSRVSRKGSLQAVMASKFKRGNVLQLIIIWIRLIVCRLMLLYASLQLLANNNGAPEKLKVSRNQHHSLQSSFHAARAYIQNDVGRSLVQ